MQAFEFHHGRPLPSRHSSHSSTGGGGWHERQRSQNKAAATGASGLAGLNLMPQSLLPEIMPDIPQMLGESRSTLLTNCSSLLQSCDTCLDCHAQTGCMDMAAEPKFVSLRLNVVANKSPPTPVILPAEGRNRSSNFHVVRHCSFRPVKRPTNSH